MSFAREFKLVDPVTGLLSVTPKDFEGHSHIIEGFGEMRLWAHDDSNSSKHGIAVVKGQIKTEDSSYFLSRGYFATNVYIGVYPGRGSFNILARVRDPRSGLLLGTTFKVEDYKPEARGFERFTGNSDTWGTLRETIDYDWFTQPDPLELSQFLFSIEKA